jgi:transcriptional regulator
VGASGAIGAMDATLTEGLGMLIHPWDAALDDLEWRQWLSEGRDFGQLAVNGRSGEPPVVQPVHFAIDGDCLLVHLARPNPIWRYLEARPEVLLSVVDDYAFIPGPWRVPSGYQPENGVPTSYYAVVQFSCRAEMVDDPEAKADLLRRQLAHFQPEGDHVDVAVGQPPYGPMLNGIRGVRLHVLSVAAKFKYDDRGPSQQRASVAARLDARASGRDVQAAVQQRRRLDRLGDWRQRAAPLRWAQRLRHR